MLVKNLPFPEIKELMIKRAKEQRTGETVYEIMNSAVDECITWHYTEEGTGFWSILSGFNEESNPLKRKDIKLIVEYVKN